MLKILSSFAVFFFSVILSFDIRIPRATNKFAGAEVTNLYQGPRLSPRSVLLNHSYKDTNFKENMTHSVSGKSFEQDSPTSRLEYTNPGRVNCLVKNYLLLKLDWVWWKCRMPMRKQELRICHLFLEQKVMSQLGLLPTNLHLRYLQRIYNR